jgi:hypothetical protein
MAPKIARRSPDEIRKADILEKELATAVAVLALPPSDNAKQDLRRQQSARAAERRCKKELAEIAAAVEQRQKKYNRDEETRLQNVERAKVVALFPDVIPPQAERAALLVRLKTHRAGLDGEQLSLARQYLSGFIEAIETATAAEKQTAAQAKEISETKQRLLDEAAAQTPVQKIMDRMTPYFLTRGLSLSVRQKLENVCVAKAREFRAAAKTVEGFDETGASKRYVVERMAETFEALVEKLEIFRVDMNHPPTVDKLRERDSFWVSEACAPENWNFRTTEEQSYLRFICQYYFQSEGYHSLLDTLPHAPDPLVVPRAAGPLEHAVSRGDSLVHNLATRTEENRRRMAHLERLRTEDPKAYAKLSESDLKPVSTLAQQVIYEVPVNKLGEPYRTILYWPWGTPANYQEVVKTPIGWCLTPEPAVGDAWGNGNLRTETVQDDAGNWVRKAVDVGEKWIQGDDGGWIREDTGATGRLDAPVKLCVIAGDRKPTDPSDPRTYFRHGSWFTKSEIDRVEESEDATNFRIPRSPSPAVATHVASAPDENTFLPETKWTKRLQQLKSQGS